jgi:peptidoglycan/LPS O-acetylase OafA/YrhL
MQFKKILSIQAARGIAALMVLGFHALSVDRKYFPDGFLPQSFNFGQTGVDLFFVISGFVMAITTRERRGPADCARFMCLRILRIYPTYWIYFFALALVFVAVPGIINSSQGGRVDLLRSFFLLPSTTLPLLLVAWSLTLELWFYIVFAGLLLLPQRHRLKLLVLWMAGIVVYYAFADTPENVFVRVVVHPFSIEFILGALAGLLWHSSRLKKLGSAVGLTVSAAGALCVVITDELGVVDGSDVIASTSLARMTTIGFGYTALLWGVAVIERGGLRFPSALTALGDASYTLYLAHIPVLNACARMWLKVFTPVTGAPGRALLFWAATFMACIAYALIAFRLTERPLVRYVHAQLRGRRGEIVPVSEGAWHQ